MGNHFDEHAELDVKVHVTPLPIFSRPQVWWALPGMVEKFSQRGDPQYWGDEKQLSVEIKPRAAPEVQAELPWDIFILFGPEATWDDAEERVSGAPGSAHIRRKPIEADHRDSGRLVLGGVRGPRANELGLDLAEWSGLVIRA